MLNQDDQAALPERLAINGGQAAIPAGPPEWPARDETIRQAMEAAWADGTWGRYHGPHCVTLIDELSGLLDVDHVSLCCSGTVAVELALRGLQVGPGDEVVLAGYDFPGNFRAIDAVGAIPVLVDIDPTTWCLDNERLGKAIGPSTRAIVVSHLHGGLAPMSQIMEFAGDHGIRVVEDACQVPGAVVEGRAAGAWGDAGVLSFGGSKLLTAGRGGAVLTADAATHQRIRIFAERGNSVFPLSELQAAVLLPQLASLARLNARRAAAVVRLVEQTVDLDCFRPLAIPDRQQTSFYKVAWSYLPPDDGWPSREKLIAALQAEGVAVNSGFRGFTRRSGRRCRRVGSLDHSKQAAETTLLLHHPVLLQPNETVDQVAAAMRKVVHGLARS